jgi:hypothetical protein
MANVGAKLKLKIAVVLSACVVTGVWVAFVSSPQYRIASDVLAGPEMRALAGEVKLSYPSSFRLTGNNSKVSYYVLGERRRGFLQLDLVKEDGRFRVKSATFDQEPLLLQQQKSE